MSGLLYLLSTLSVTVNVFFVFESRRTTSVKLHLLSNRMNKVPRPWKEIEVEFGKHTPYLDVMLQFAVQSSVVRSFAK